MSRKHVSGMKGWTDIGSDVSWDEYGGRWARRARDGSWYVVEFMDMYEACGEDECKNYGQCRYVCEVNRVDLTDLDAETLKSALQGAGLQIVDKTPIDGIRAIVSDQGDVVATSNGPTWDLVLVEAYASSGAKQPLESFSGDTRPANVRANARRAAEALMRDAVALEAKLDRPVNAIGATAREYARGEIMPALNRNPEKPENALMLRMVGMPTLGGGTFGEK